MQGPICKTCEYGYRIVDGRCMACFSSESGYVNCPNECYYDNPYQAIDLNLDQRGHLGNETILIPSGVPIDFIPVDE